MSEQDKQKEKAPEFTEPRTEPEKPVGAKRKTPVYVGLGLVALLAAFLIIRSGVFSSKPDSTAEPQATQIQEPAVPELGIGSTKTRQKDGMEMVYVPEGSFEMGSTKGYDDEKPVRQVYLDAYWIDKYEVTNGQYKQCVAAGACTLPGASGSNTRSSYYDNTSYANYPVITVDWYQAQEYCQWAGGDLPTEAQWEKAARGTNGREFPWGNDVPNSSLANFNGNQGDTVEVGSYPQGVSHYGALDMAGNVWEWVRDWYEGYDANETNNPTGPSSGTYRVLHGGSWNNDTWSIRAANRGSYYPMNWDDFIGFRCVSPP